MNARLMKMPVTGNARRESFAHLPMPRMTNTYMLAGDKDPEEILASVKNGLYAVNFGGGQVDITNGKFVFSASEAYMIENGKITYPVKGATLIGNGPDVLNRVSMIGNDMRARFRRRRVRQGRPERAGRRRPADPAHRRRDGGRHRLSLARHRAGRPGQPPANSNLHQGRRLRSLATRSAVSGWLDR